MPKRHLLSSRIGSATGGPGGNFTAVLDGPKANRTPTHVPAVLYPSPFAHRERRRSSDELNEAEVALALKKLHANGRPGQGSEVPKAHVVNKVNLSSIKHRDSSRHRRAHELTQHDAVRRRRKPPASKASHPRSHAHARMHTD